MHESNQREEVLPPISIFSLEDHDAEVVARGRFVNQEGSLDSIFRSRLHSTVSSHDVCPYAGYIMKRCSWGVVYETKEGRKKDIIWEVWSKGDCSSRIEMILRNKREVYFFHKALSAWEWNFHPSDIFMSTICKPLVFVVELIFNLWITHVTLVGQMRNLIKSEEDLLWMKKNLQGALEIKKPFNMRSVPAYRVNYLLQKLECYKYSSPHRVLNKR